SNIIWAPLKDGLQSVSLSANWMWPCKNDGEDARLYEAVKACSDFAIDLGINIPTGKDSLSMKQKYSNGEVIAPGTVIISAAAHCVDITAVVEPVLQKNKGAIYYINLSGDKPKLGGSSFAQILNCIGNDTPDIIDPKAFKEGFNAVQELIKSGKIHAGHDIGSGGLITTLLEMCFADRHLGAQIDLSALEEQDSIKLLFAENVGVVFQADESIELELNNKRVTFHKIGQVSDQAVLELTNNGSKWSFDIDELRDVWFRTSYLLDQKQSGEQKAAERFKNYKNHILKYSFPKHFDGKKPQIDN